MNFLIVRHLCWRTTLPSAKYFARQLRRIVTLSLMFSPPLFIFLRWIADSFYFALFYFGESLCHSIFGRFPFADHLINVNCNCTGHAVNAPRFAIWLALRWVTIPVATPMQFLIKKVTKSLDLICRWQCFSGVVRKVISTLLGCRRSWIMYRIHTWPQPITLTLFWSGMRATYLFAYWIGWRSLTVNATEVRSGRRRPGRCI